MVIWLHNPTPYTYPFALLIHRRAWQTNALPEHSTARSFGNISLVVESLCKCFSCEICLPTPLVVCVEEYTGFRFVVVLRQKTRFYEKASNVVHFVTVACRRFYDGLRLSQFP